MSGSTTTPAVPTITIAGRTYELHLTIGALMDAEATCPGLSLLDPTSWVQVGTSVRAAVALLYGCMRSEPDRPTIAWLAEHIEPPQISEIAVQLTTLMMRELATGEDDDIPFDAPAPAGEPPTDA